MNTIILVVVILAVAGFVAYKFANKGVIKDENNNNIPDVIEEKIEAVKEAVEVVKATTKKAKKVAKEVEEAVETIAPKKRGRKPAQK
jgi:mRNA degradation ribonuclease J1/J2